MTKIHHLYQSTDVSAAAERVCNMLYHVQDLESELHDLLQIEDHHIRQAMVNAYGKQFSSKCMLTIIKQHLQSAVKKLDKLEEVL